MVSAQDLRALGHDGLAAALTHRPDVLLPVPPRSLTELATRLSHPFSLALALRPLNRACLQVAEALAALGSDGDRDRLDELLGVHDDVARCAVDQALIALSGQLLLQTSDAEQAAARPTLPTVHDQLRGSLRLLPQAAELWHRPLGLDRPLCDLLRERTAADLQSALRALGERAPARKADATQRLIAVLGDPERVRQIVQSAPAPVREQLQRAAHRSHPLLRVLFGGWHHDRRGDPSAWAVERLLLVPHGWYGELAMPAEVALALRGPGWHAPFDPMPPPLTWNQNAAELVEREAAAAAAHAVRTVAAVLQQVGATPMPLIKSGAVGVRELRRIAKLVGCAVWEVRLTLALGLWTDMIGLEEDRVTPTVGFDGWSAAEPAPRLAALVEAWLDLPECPLTEPDAAWQPGTDPGAAALRAHVLAEMAGHPGGAPSSMDELAQWAMWQVPLSRTSALQALDHANDDVYPDDDADLFGDDLAEADPATAGADRIAQIAHRGAVADVAHTIRSVLAEAAWLGLTGAGALSAAGAAAIAGEDVASAVESGLGTVQQTARLQGDLTAVVLGHASPRLADVLDQLADRESRSTAGVWRFTPSSIRRAMDGGLDEPTIHNMLTAIAETQVPQPLTYLVSDVARRHGQVRVGAVSSYLRCEDDVLLSELLADRSLRRLELRRIASGVIGAAADQGVVLGTLRAAGYLPVAEDVTGSVTRERRETKRVRALTDLPSTPGALGDGLESALRELSDDEPGEGVGLDLDQVVADLLAAPDRSSPGPRGPDANVIDMAAFEELLRRQGEQGE